MAKKSRFQHGFLYVLFDILMEKLQYTSIVEYFKFALTKKFSDTSNSNKSEILSNIAIDIFIVLKWLFVFLAWICNFNNLFISSIVIYLIITNLYTYFFYHVWDIESLNLDNFSIGKVRRRFINLLSAFSFSIYSFAYLFQIPFVNHFNWSNDNSSFVKSVLFSSANSLTAGFEGITPKDTVGNLLAISEIVISFIFIAIIFSKSLPQTQSKN